VSAFGRLRDLTLDQKQPIELTNIYVWWDPKLTPNLSTFYLLKRFWTQTARRHWPFFALGLACMALVSLTTAALPLFIKLVMDLLASLDGQFFWLIPLVLINIVIRAGAIYFQTVITNVAVMRSLRDLQTHMFSHLMATDLERLVRTAPGHLVTHFTNDINVMREMLWRTTTGLRDASQIVFLVGVLIHLDWLLTVLVLVVYPAAAVPIVVIGQRLRQASSDNQKNYGTVTSFLSEAISGARMIKTYRLENYERKAAAAEFQRMYALFMNIVRNRARLDPILEVIGGFAVVGVIAAGGWRVVNGTITIGDLMGFISALFLLAPAVRALGTLNNVLQEGLAAVERAYAILDEPPQIVDAEDARSLVVDAGRVVFRHVDFSYDAETSILSDFSIHIEPGTTVALVGPSGAGKSTVLNLIPRLYEASGGEILIDNQNIRSVTLDSLRDAIAFVSQDVVLFDDTIRMNIALGRLEATEEEIIAAAKAAAAHEFIEDLPNGYDTVVGDRGIRLSGGQRQRIAIARAMLKDPKILLLDEATSALDAESEMRVQEALDRLREGRTTLVIAHRLATVRNADKIYVMDEGHVREEGSHEKLLATDGLYAKLSKLQFRAADSLPAQSSNDDDRPDAARGAENR